MIICDCACALPAGCSLHLTNEISNINISIPIVSPQPQLYFVQNTNVQLISM